MTNPYHYETEEAITRKDISDEDIEEYNYCVGVHSRTYWKELGDNPNSFYFRRLTSNLLCIKKEVFRLPFLFLLSH